MAGSKIVGLRISCTRAAVIDEARICEVRVYAAGEDGPFPSKAQAIEFERARIVKALEVARRKEAVGDAGGAAAGSAAPPAPASGAGAGSRESGSDSWPEEDPGIVSLPLEMQASAARLRAMRVDPWAGPGRIVADPEPEILRLALPPAGAPFADASWKEAIGS